MLCSRPSTRSNIHRMPPNYHVLPVEVFETILDQASDHRRSLRNISLTCHIFLPRARHHLFNSILVKSKEQMHSVPVFLQANLWLLPLVQVVKLRAKRSLPIEMQYSYGWLEAVPVPLLAQLPNLCCFDLQGIGPLHGSLSPSRLTLSALGVYSAPIRHLELTRIAFSRIDDLMRYLLAFPSLSRLACEDVWF